MFNVPDNGIWLLLVMEGKLDLRYHRVGSVVALAAWQVDFRLAIQPLRMGGGKQMGKTLGHWHREREESRAQVSRLTELADSLGCQREREESRAEVSRLTKLD
jgi:hypothetical protein